MKGMVQMSPRTCARTGCDNPVLPKGSRAPAPICCSGACRAAVHRMRARERAFVPVVDADELHLPRTADTTQQLAHTVAEARSVALAFARLSAEVTDPMLASRCRRTFNAFRATLQSTFPQVETAREKPDPARKGRRAPAAHAESDAAVARGEEFLASVLPSALGALQAEIWEICTQEMAAQGPLRPSDLILTLGYCNAAAQMIEAHECIHEHGAMMKAPIVAWDTVSGKDVLVGWRLEPNPALKVALAATNSLRLTSEVLLLNPAARIRFGLEDIARLSLSQEMREHLERKTDARLTKKTREHLERKTDARLTKKRRER